MFCLCLQLHFTCGTCFPQHPSKLKFSCSGSSLTSSLTSPSLPLCPSRLYICSPFSALPPVLPSPDTSISLSQKSIPLSWLASVFISERMAWLEGLDLSSGVLRPPASHLAFGLRNLRPAKTALSPSASSILEGRPSQSCAFPNQQLSVSHAQAYCTPCTYLMSWLYLARRSERQGAPVLI